MRCGAVMALDMPIGIGPLQFSKYFPEDTHNSFLNAFMSGGWLAGVFYPALVALTLVFGFRMVFVRTPWQQTTIVVFAGYFGVADRKLHHRHRPLAAHLPADGRDVGPDRGDATATKAHAKALGRGRPPAVPTIVQPFDAGTALSGQSGCFG